MRAQGPKTKDEITTKIARLLKAKEYTEVAYLY